MRKTNEKRQSSPAEQTTASKPTPPVLHNGEDTLIREQAYLLWEAAGCPPGDGVEFWLQAEAGLRPDKEVAASDT